MKQKIILSIAILSLLSLAVFVSAKMTPYIHPSRPDFGEVYKFDIEITEGWNLAPYYNMYSKDVKYWKIDSTSEINKEDIKAIYIYSPLHNEYWQFFPNNKLDTHENPEMIPKLTDYMSVISDDDYFYAGAVWIYSDKSGRFKFESNVPDSKKLRNERDLFDGWNFLIITPDMVDKNLDQIKGNCDIENQYAWWDEGQEWDDIPSDGTFPQELEGKGIIIKVKNNCKIGISTGEIPDVPTIPN